MMSRGVDELKTLINTYYRFRNETDAKMEEIKTNLINAEEASKTRTEKISELEGKLENAKAEADEKLNKINSAIGSLPTGLQEDLIKQGSEILTVVSKLEALEERVTEQSSQIGKTDEIVAAASAAQEEKLRGQIKELESKVLKLEKQMKSLLLHPPPKKKNCEARSKNWKAKLTPSTRKSSEFHRLFHRKFY